MCKTKQVGKGNTVVFTENGKTKVIYYQTKVVEFDAKTITLDNGGYATKSTKERMNQAASQYDLGYYVFQNGGKWFVSLGVDDLEFVNGSVTLNREVHA
jgi:hypothetical protein